MFTVFFILVMATTTKRGERKGLTRMESTGAKGDTGRGSDDNRARDTSGVFLYVLFFFSILPTIFFFTNKLCDEPA